MNKTRLTWLLGCCLLISAMTDVMAATAQARIGFSSKTVGLDAANTRSAGSSEYVEIVFIAADGTIDPSIVVTVASSDASVISASLAPAATALGNYILSVPANAVAGASASINLSAAAGGISYTRSRSFVIAANTPLPPSPPPLPPAGTSTTIRAATPTLNADQSGCAAVNYYDVGPGKPYAALGQLPWSQLQGCDTVRIYPKANNAAYHEMMLISAGTNLAPAAPNKFMRVIGMPDPVTGVRPVIDGSNATQLETLPGQAPRSLQYHDNNSMKTDVNGNPVSTRALYKLGLVMVGPQLGYNYSSGAAGYISIENLDIGNSSYNVPFTEGKYGTQDSYSSFGTCLFVEAAAHLVVKNNLLHDCGNGLFINSKNGALVELSQDVLIEGNVIYNNSNPPIAGASNGFSEHNSYTEARDIIFQYNYFGDVRPGAGGACLKDRSSGLIIRYNNFASNCLVIDLQDSTGGNQLIYGDAGYSKTSIYGNLFDLKPGVSGNSLIHYGGDSGQTASYRQGTLYFYNNTATLKGDATHGLYPEVLLFNLDMPKAVADVKNNVFQTSPITAGAAGKIQAMAVGKGTVVLSNNWVSPNAAQYWLGHLTGAVVSGWNTNSGAGNNPGFLNAAQHDYRLAAGSPLINAGVDPTMFNLVVPIAEPSPITVRKQNGAIDIGAFEY